MATMHDLNIEPGDLVRVTQIVCLRPEYYDATYVRPSGRFDHLAKVRTPSGAEHDVEWCNVAKRMAS